LHHGSAATGQLLSLRAGRRRDRRSSAWGFATEQLGKRSLKRDAWVKQQFDKAKRGK